MKWLDVSGLFIFLLWGKKNPELVVPDSLRTNKLS